VLRRGRNEWVEDLVAGQARVLGRVPYRLFPRYGLPSPLVEAAFPPALDGIVLEAGRRAFALVHPPEKRVAIRSRVPAAYLPTERSAMARDVLGAQTWAELTEAGVFALWLVEEAEEVTAVLVPRPEMSVVEGRLHADDHPAVRWPSGLGYWFWDGVWIPQHLAERRDALHVGDVIAERNAERRRVLASRVGWERLMREGGGRVIQEDAYGRLWLMRHEDDEPFVAVEVENATEEPDGTRRRYFLRVPPSTRTARGAVAWTFGLAKTAYSPEVES